MDLLLILLVIVVVFVLLAASFYAAWTPYVKPKMMKYVTAKIMANIPQHAHPAELNLNDARSCGRLVYTHKNKEHIIYLPYDPKLLRKVGYKVVHKLGDVSVDITQEAGVPYLVTADALGGGSVEVYKDDELKHTFTGSDSIKF